LQLSSSLITLTNILLDYQLAGETGVDIVVQIQATYRDTWDEYVGSMNRRIADDGDYMG